MRWLSSWQGESDRPTSWNLHDSPTAKLRWTLARLACHIVSMRWEQSRRRPAHGLQDRVQDRSSRHGELAQGSGIHAQVQAGAASGGSRRRSERNRDGVPCSDQRSEFDSV